MIYCENSAIKKIVLHFVGNKLYNENIKFSKVDLQLDESINSTLVNYFLPPFKTDEYYNLYHESDIKYNEVYGFVTNIFNNPDSFYEQSLDLAKHLYEQSIHPKTKGGEFCIVYFKDCTLNGNTVDAVGLFKSENKDTFLNIFFSSDRFQIESQKGINTNKLDKGCMIFNTERDNGYVVAVVDNTNKSSEAQFWIDDFLHVKQRQDEYFNTQNVLSICKNFVTKELPQQFEVSKADQVDFLNKSVKYFKENELFDLEEFSKEVIIQPEIIKSFKNYKSSFQKDYDIDLDDNFVISETAVKKQSRTFKNIIKLDKNFHIYIHGNRNLIEQGIEKDGRKYYKIYYKEEI